MLGLWEYFWSWNDIPIPVAVSPLASAGSGGKASNNYMPMPEEYWEARANQIVLPKIADEIIQERKQRLLEEVKQIIVEQQQVALLRQNHVIILANLKNSTSLEDLRQFSALSKELKEQLGELKVTNKARIIRAQMLRSSLYN